MDNTIYHFDIIPKDWAKRRKPAVEAKPVSVTIPDFELISQHFCTMHVQYDDGSEKSFYSRVIYNQLTDQWTVDGMHVAVRVRIEQIH